MSDDITKALEKIFAADSELYQDSGFQRRIGFGHLWQAVATGQTFQS